MATFDQTSQQLRLYLDGSLVSETEIAIAGGIVPSAEILLIGKHNQAAIVERAFTANTFNGLIDELKIHQHALAATEVQATYTAYLDGLPGRVLPTAETAPDRSRYDGDRHRPQYHFIPPEHWMNEPHAPLYFNGQYHIFYQHNPQGPYWHQIHWGHAVSDDMVHWRDLPVALAPTADSVAPDGVWSGSAAIDDSGNPALFITAGNDSVFPNQATGLARSTYATDGDNDLVNWMYHPEPITVQSPICPLSRAKSGMVNSAIPSCGKMATPGINWWVRVFAMSAARPCSILRPI